MKQSVFVISVIFLIAFKAAAQKSKSIDWQTDYRKAQALSRETGKPLLLDFTAVWCKPCKIMDEQFWVRADIVETMKSFVAVKLDYDKERSLAGRFSVRGIPYVAFVDPIGNLITYRNGFGTKKANELSEIFNEMPKDFSPLKKAYDAIELKKNDGLPLLQIADFYRTAGMLVLSNDYYRRANRTYEVNKDAERRELITAVVGLNFYAVRDYKQANESLEDYLKIFPSGKYEEIATAALAVGCANLNKFKEAERYMEILKTKFPASKSLETATKIVEDVKNKIKR